MSRAISDQRNLSFHEDSSEWVHEHSFVADDMQPTAEVRFEQTRPVPKSLLEIYFSEIRQVKLLTREKEIELGKKVREEKDPKAAQRLVTANLRLVAKIAMNFSPHWAGNYLDLIQAGNLGLVQATKKFDPDKGVKFSYYASFWIKAYIFKFILDNWRLVKIGTTQSQRKLFFRLGKAKAELRARGVIPTPAILAGALDVKEEEVIEMTQRMSSRDLSLSWPALNFEEPFETLMSDPSARADEQLSENQDWQILRSTLKKYRKTLYGREADIFDHRILAERPLTLQELAKKHHISRERVRQLQLRLTKEIEVWLRKEMPDQRQLEFPPDDN